MGVREKIPAKKKALVRAVGRSSPAAKKALVRAGAPKSRTAKTNGRLVLEDFLPYRLSVLTNRISHAIAHEYGARFGLTIPEWRVMAVLGRFAPASAGEVAERSAMDKVRVSRAVARLKRSGLIVAATDSADRRRSALRLSAPGRRIYRRIVPLALGLEAELIGALTPSERATLDGLLAKLHARAEMLDRG